MHQVSQNTRVFRNDEHGAVLVESAIGIFAGFILLILGLDVLRVAYTVYSANHAIEDTARWASLGAGSGTRVHDIKEKLIEISKPYGLEIEQDQIRVCPASAPSCPIETTGGSNKFFRLSLRLPIAFLAFFDLEFDYTLEEIARNEPY